jgi:hypothetical protein
MGDDLMGMWGFEPWDNDLAADWFAELFQKGKVADRVEKALSKKDVEEYWPEIRAAAHVITGLGDVWPHDKLKAHHRLAIDKLEAVKGTADFDGDAAMAAEIDAQVAVLRERLEALADPANPEADAKIPPKYDPAPALAKLKDSNPQMRKAGLLWLGKFTHASPHRWTENWLKDPATTEALLPLLDDPEPELAEQALVNISGIMFRHPKNVRVFPAAVRMMRSDRPKTRAMAAYVAGQFDSESALDDFLQLFEDKDKMVRTRAIGAVAHACRDWSAAAKARVREAARTALADRTDEVRCAAAALLALVGGREELPAIKKAKAAASHAGWKREFAEIVKFLKKD